MPDITPSAEYRFRRKYILAVLFWSVLIGISLVWNLRQEAGETMSMAVTAARSNISRDILFRKWVAFHGGVYVPQTEKTPPNPYLKVPDRDVVSTTGKTLTLMNPAYALRELQGMNDDLNSKTHITSLKLLNPHNSADEWESAALKSFEQGSKEAMEINQVDGLPHLRLMRPFVTTPECLKCHEQQGYKVGDIRGGISADVSLAIYQADENKRNTIQSLSHGFVWLIGLIGLGATYRREQHFELEQEKIDAARRESEELFSNYFSLGQVGMCITSLDQKWLRVNARLCEMLGYTQEELVTMTWIELTHPEDLELDLVQFKRLVSGEIERYSLDKRFIHKFGSIVYTHLTVSCKRKFDKTLDYVIASLEDITERKQVETSLRESEDRYRKLFETTMDGILLTSTDGSIFAANPAACIMFQRTEEEIRQVGRSGLVDISDPRLEKALEERKRTGKFMGELALVRKDGTKFSTEVSTSVFQDSDGQQRTSMAIRDISERKRLEEQIRHLAFFDPLTKLPNRRLLEDRLSQAMATSKRSNRYGAIMFLDLDNFKPLNDKHGHGVGDLLLIEVAHRINSCIRESDTAARFGGDEFVVILTELDKDETGSAAQAGIVAEKIRATLAEPYLLSIPRESKESNAEHIIEHHCTSSIGVALFINHESSAGDVIKSADMAMYQAKEAGRNNFQFYKVPT